MHFSLVLRLEDGLFNPMMEYDMGALIDTLIWNLIAFSIIPILPITLLYIIIYVIVNKRKNKYKGEDR